MVYTYTMNSNKDYIVKFNNEIFEYVHFKDAVEKYNELVGE